MLRFAPPFETALDAAGVTLPGAKLYFYTTGTTTPAATYSNTGLSVANANPVVADSGGRFSDIFLNPATIYKSVLKTSADVIVWTADPINSAALATADLAGLVKAASLSSNGADLQAIMDKLAGTVNAASISNTVSDQQAITDKLDFLQTGTGAVTRSLGARLRDVVSVRDFGAALDGTTDDTAAWTAALATGKDILFPAGTSKITDKLAFSATEGQQITGNGRYKSQFAVSYTTFAMATAVLQLGAAHQGIHNLGVVFVQPSTAVRASIKQYPRTIDLAGYSRAMLSGLLISGGWIGIYGQGNCGGSCIDDIQCGAISQGLYLDNALDSVRISRFHHWPFGFVADVSLLSVWQDNSTIGLDIGRVDDIHITDLLLFSSRIRFLDYGNGAPSGHVNNLALDSKYSTIEMTDGKITMSNVNSGTSVTDHAPIILYGGELKISNLAMECGTEHLPLVNVIDGTFIVSNLMVTSYGAGSRVVHQTGGRMWLSHGYIETGATTRTVPMIDIAAGRAVVTGMKASDAGAHTGDFIKVTTDDFHTIVGNQSLGYSFNFPTDKVSGIYEPNGSVAGGLQGAAFLASPHWTRYTGTLDGAGAATINHGLTDPRTKLLSVSAFCVSGANQVPVTVASISATQIVLSGGGAAAAYICLLCVR
jgi:hypothetical protein